MITELTLDNTVLVQRFLNAFSFLISPSELIREYYENPYLHYLIYQVGDQVVGYLNYSFIYDRIELNQIHVLESMRGKKIASSLMQRLIEKAEEQSAINITLEVKCDNISAIALYQKFHFQKKAIRSGYYNGVDGILMEKEMIK